LRADRRPLREIVKGSPPDFGIAHGLRGEPPLLQMLRGLPVPGADFDGTAFV
jgi:hypothetical protein